MAVQTSVTPCQGRAPRLRQMVEEAGAQEQGCRRWALISLQRHRRICPDERPRTLQQGTMRLGIRAGGCRWVPSPRQPSAGADQARWPESDRSRRDPMLRNRHRLDLSCYLEQKQEVSARH
jgi:hypothetical protein